VTSWDDVQAARNRATEYAKQAIVGGSKADVYSRLAIQAEIRALELALSMLLTPYPDSEATLGGDG
jgi:hypothetical protein